MCITPIRHTRYRLDAGQVKHDIIKIHRYHAENAT